MFRLIEIIFFISDMSKVERGNAPIIQHRLLAHCLPQNLLVQLFGLFEFSLPVENFGQELESCKHPKIILRRPQQRPGLNRLIRATYELLGLQTYFTAGPKEVRAWTMHRGDTAPQAAGVIHTDFEKGFIRAEVIAYDDFINYKGEQGAKEAGKMRLEGKDYIVRDGDVMHFRFNV